MDQTIVDSPQFHDSIDEIPPPCVTPVLTGHQQACANMVDAARSGHHAMILQGERGVGKATSAFHLANMMLANDEIGSGGVIHPPDTKNSNYRQIAQNTHPNLLYLTRPLKDDGKGFKTVITVDEVRRLHRFLGMSAAAQSRRIIIIDCLGDMNRNAANAILKLLEEPPSNTLFIIISHGTSGMLATIRSRCQLIRFLPLENDEVERVLKAIAGPIMADSDIPRLAALSGGSVRHALMMARSGGLELRDTLNELLRSLHFDTEVAHKLADVAGMRGSDEHNLLLRELVLNAVQQGGLSRVSSGNLGEAEKFSRFAAEFTERARIADGFNLDRRQEFLVVAAQLHALFHPVGRSVN